MSSFKCLMVGHKWRRGSTHTVKLGLVDPDIFMCLRCKKQKEAPATFYTPMDIPPPPKHEPAKATLKDNLKDKGGE